MHFVVGNLNLFQQKIWRYFEGTIDITSINHKLVAQTCGQNLKGTNPH